MPYAPLHFGYPQHPGRPQLMDDGQVPGIAFRGLQRRTGFRLPAVGFPAYNDIRRELFVHQWILWEGVRDTTEGREDLPPLELYGPHRWPRGHQIVGAPLYDLQRVVDRFMPNNHNNQPGDDRPDAFMTWGAEGHTGNPLFAGQYMMSPSPWSGYYQINFCTDDSYIRVNISTGTGAIVSQDFVETWTRNLRTAGEVDQNGELTERGDVTYPNIFAMEWQKTFDYDLEPYDGSNGKLLKIVGEVELKFEVPRYDADANDGLLVLGTVALVSATPIAHDGDPEIDLWIGTDQNSAQLGWRFVGNGQSQLSVRARVDTQGPARYATVPCSVPIA